MKMFRYALIICAFSFIPLLAQNTWIGCSGSAVGIQKVTVKYIQLMNGTQAYFGINETTSSWSTQQHIWTFDSSTELGKKRLAFLMAAKTTNSYFAFYESTLVSTGIYNLGELLLGTY